MNKMFLAVVAALALFFPSIAHACTVEVWNTVSKETAYNAYPSETAAAFAVALADMATKGGESAISVPVECRQTFLNQLGAKNGWNDSTPWSAVGNTIQVPRISKVPAAAPAGAPVLARTAEVAQTSQSAAAAAEIAQVREEKTRVREEQAQVREEQAKVQTQKADLERAVQTFLRNNPVKVQWTEDQKKSFDDAQATIAEHDRKIKALDGRLTSLESRMTTLETEMVKKADMLYVDEQNGTQDAAIAKNAKDIKNLQGKTGESLSWWQEYGIIGAIILSILALLAAARVFFRKTPTPVDTSNFATSAELELLSTKVEVINSRFKHSLLRTTDTPKPFTLKRMAVGTEFDYSILVDGQPVVFKGRVVQHASSGEAIVKMDELSKPVAASKLFGELASYIENGGQLPTLRVVNT